MTAGRGGERRRIEIKSLPGGLVLFTTARGLMNDTLIRFLERRGLWR